LSNTKLPKAKPIVELLNGTFICSSKWVPPRLNGSILKVIFLQGHGFFVLITKGFVLIMELWCYQLLGVFVQKLSPMEKASPFFVNHFHYKISNPINNSNNIMVCLHTIRMNPLKTGIPNLFFSTSVFSFLHKMHWTFVSLDYMSQIAIVMTL
jgi:hypothetical protein